MDDVERPLEGSRLARAGIAVVVFGFTVFLIGIFPNLINLDLTPGMGIVQITTFLFAIGVMTLGGYIYAYATRHRATKRRLREDIGLRLMATGYVLCAVSGLADVLGIGSHNIQQSAPFFGLWQSVGLLVGLLVIGFGVLLYAQRYSPPLEAEQDDPAAKSGDGPSNHIKLDLSG